MKNPPNLLTITVLLLQKTLFYLDPLKQYSMHNVLNTIEYFNPGPDNYSFELR